MEHLPDQTPRIDNKQTSVSAEGSCISVTMRRSPRREDRAGLSASNGTKQAVTLDQRLAAMTLDMATEFVHSVPPFQPGRPIAVDRYS